jgi:2-(1,2-epoxy-1,2-dihydrophenyl)acetyl-CoA isomerase
MVASGDDPDAPERIRVDHRGDRAVVTLDESDRLNVLSAPLGASTAADAAGPRR